MNRRDFLKSALSGIYQYFIPAFALFMIAVFITIAINHPGNVYKNKGELYQCFVDGEPVYKGNRRPAHRGANWYIVNNDKFQADDCICMGCIGF